MNLAGTILLALSLAAAGPDARTAGPALTGDPNRPDAVVPETERPIRFAVILMAPDLRSGDPNVAASAANWRNTINRGLQSLPTSLAGRRVKYQTLDPADSRALARLADYKAAILLPEWSIMLPALDGRADAIRAYVRRGGGLVVFQPNPLVVHPAGAKPPTALAERDIDTEYCTPALLGVPATFYNRYRKFEGVRNLAAKRHAITFGLSDEQMPYPADQIVSIDRQYTVLARGASSGSPSLAATAFGDGRIVLIADNAGGTSAARRGPPATVVARSLLWAARADDAVIRTLTAKAAEVPAVAFSPEPADEQGEGPYRPAEVEIVYQPAGDAVEESAVEAGQAAPDDDRPRSVLARALAQALPGDVIRLQAGVYNAGSLVVPPGVSLVGAGAANTVVKVTCPKPMGAGLALDGNSVVQDVTILGTGRRKGHLVRAAGRSATPTIRRCVLIPQKGDFCAVCAWDGAAPTLSRCVIVSPVGDYGVFARRGAAPVIDHCTIVSRGFGIGMMGGSTPTIRRCILAGQSPGVLIEAGCEPAVRDCVIFCKAGSGTYRHAVTRWRVVSETPDGESEAKARIVAEPALDILKRDDILKIDPKLRTTASLRGWLAPANGAVADYGAYAGAAWPKAVTNAPKVDLPPLETGKQ